MLLICFTRDIVIMQFKLSKSCSPLSPFDPGENSSKWKKDWHLKHWPKVTLFLWLLTWSKTLAWEKYNVDDLLTQQSIFYATPTLKMEIISSTLVVILPLFGITSPFFFTKPTMIPIASLILLIHGHIPLSSILLLILHGSRSQYFSFGTLGKNITKEPLKENASPPVTFGKSLSLI